MDTRRSSLQTKTSITFTTMRSCHQTWLAAIPRKESYSKHLNHLYMTLIKTIVSSQIIPATKAWIRYKILLLKHPWLSYQPILEGQARRVNRSEILAEATVSVVVLLIRWLVIAEIEVANMATTSKRLCQGHGRQIQCKLTNQIINCLHSLPKLEITTNLSQLRLRVVWAHHLK